VWYRLPKSGALFFSEAPMRGLEPVEEPVPLCAAPAPERAPEPAEGGDEA
jgi:hypothetical protein